MAALAAIFLVCGKFQAACSTIHIEAVGNGGTLLLNVTGPQNAFFGFHDPLGLLSVSFQNVTIPPPGFGIAN